MVRPGVKGIAFCQAVKEQRPEADRLVGLFRKKPLCLFKSKCVQVQDQPRPDDGPSGKPSARRQMTVENDIDAKQYDDRDQNSCAGLQNRIILGFKNAVVFLFLLSLAVLFRMEQNQDRHRGHEQHIGLPKGVKGSIIQNHSRDDIHRPGFLQTFFNVALRHLIVHRIVRMAEVRQIGYRHKQQNYQENAEKHTEHPINLLKSPDLKIMLQVIDPLL